MMDIKFSILFALFSYLLGQPVYAEQVIINKGSYIIHFNTERCEPDYVEWDLSAKTPRFKRAADFYVEPNLLTCARPAEYRHSGYDIGHMCPSADKGPITFSMANVVPQTPGLNRGPWKDLENYCRKLHKDLHISAGVYGIVGKLDGRVIIPGHCWKIVLDKEGNSIAAVDMPNINIKGHHWQEYQDEIEDINKHRELGE